MDFTDEKPDGPRSRRKGGRWRKSKAPQNLGTEDQIDNTLTPLMQSTTIDDKSGATSSSKRKGTKRGRKKKQKSKTALSQTKALMVDPEIKDSSAMPDYAEMFGSDEFDFLVESQSEDSEDGFEADQSGDDEQIIKDYILQMSSNSGPSFLGIQLSGAAENASVDSWEWSQVDPIPEPPSRPKRKQKGSLAQPPHVSDPELQEKIEASWKKDRMAKSIRKKEREVLRHQGLLKAKTDGLLDDLYDLRPHYPSGLQLSDLRHELANFCLTNSYLNLALPPTNPAARESIHRIVHKLGMKSKSHGKDEERYIIISKLSTVEMQWSEKVFDRLAKSSRLIHTLKWKQMPKKDTRANHTPLEDDETWNKEPPKRPGALKAKGWMEKMGWTEGQGLGSIENKGIVDPIQVQQKFSRGGLGWGA